MRKCNDKDDARNCESENLMGIMTREEKMRLRARLVHSHNNPWEYSDLKPEDINQPEGEIFDE